MAMFVYIVYMLNKLYYHYVAHSNNVYYVFFLLDQLTTVNDTILSIVDFLNGIYFIDILMFVTAFLTAYTGIQYFIENRDHVNSIFESCFRVFKPSEE